MIKTIGITMIELKKWVALKATPLLIVSLAMLLTPILQAEASVIKDLRIGSNDRFIIDAYRPVSSAAANLPIKKAHQIPSIEENASLPEPTSEPEKSAPAGSSTSFDGASMNAYGSVFSKNSNADDLIQNRFQQRLIAALIVVTSIIVVLLIFLIWVGSGKKKNQAPSWTHHLPRTKDQNIENIDSVIREHLKNYDHI
ncbi:MAG: hypothetical protein HGJ94_06950 [Desulfosarcina sp.]|nr:hypothetical protein [Desulfosarcina sp.]MBC2744692.1 hypothetical protein [Desulfosarcina sp.]MBC2767601.1 hypothetical protein [Desulfosarcina sp.]